MHFHQTLNRLDNSGCIHGLLEHFFKGLGRNLGLLIKNRIEHIKVFLRNADIGQQSGQKAAAGDFGRHVAGG